MSKHAHNLRLRGAPLSAPRPRVPTKNNGVLLSACIIVKDEEKLLPRCLSSLRSVVDEVVVYDTGSTDGTVELAKSAGARVIEGYWDDDFGRARNACLEQCRGEWALWIDADECFICPSPPELRGALEARTDIDGLLTSIYNLSGDGTSPGSLHQAVRLFRKARCCWYGKLHEQVDIRPGFETHLSVAKLQGTRVDHYGYLDDVIRERDKLNRNLRLAQAELASGDVKPGQEGVAEMNVARALAAVQRHGEAQPYFDDSVARAQGGPTQRATLLFSTQNLIALARYQEAVELAQRFRQACSRRELADYFEGVALRRLGRAGEAVALLQGVGEAANEDGFSYSESLLQAELAGALLEAGRPGEAADHLVRLVSGSPTPQYVAVALKTLAAVGRSVEDLAAALPVDRLDKVAAALLIVPPVIADPLAEALFCRFGPRPQLLAAAIKFAPLVPLRRALEWSARLRAIGMTGSCPLLAQATLEYLDVVERVRAAVTAHAAFGDQRGAELALALAVGVHEDQLAAALVEVNALAPALTGAFAAAAASPGALGAGPVGTPAGRRQAVADGLARIGQTPHYAQSQNDEVPFGADGDLGAQLAATGADR